MLLLLLLEVCEASPAGCGQCGWLCEARSSHAVEDDEVKYACLRVCGKENPSAACGVALDGLCLELVLCWWSRDPPGPLCLGCSELRDQLQSHKDPAYSESVCVCVQDKSVGVCGWGSVCQCMLIYPQHTHIRTHTLSHTHTHTHTHTHDSICKNLQTHTHSHTHTHTHTHTHSHLQVELQQSKPVGVVSVYACVCMCVYECMSVCVQE